jgi:putative ABC transport system ATP-binding protein
MALSVMELISDINRFGTTIIMVTHDPALAGLAQRNVHIRDGRVSDIGADTQIVAAARG